MPDGTAQPRLSLAQALMVVLMLHSRRTLDNRMAGHNIHALLKKKMLSNLKRKEKPFRISSRREFGPKERICCHISGKSLAFYIGLKKLAEGGKASQDESFPGSLLLCFCLGHYFLFAKTSCFLAGQASV